MWYFCLGAGGSGAIRDDHNGNDTDGSVTHTGRSVYNARPHHCGDILSICHLRQSPETLGLDHSPLSEDAVEDEVDGGVEGAGEVCELVVGRVAGAARPVGLDGSPHPAHWRHNLWKQSTSFSCS